MSDKIDRTWDGKLCEHENLADTCPTCHSLKLELSLRGIVNHWREFGDMIVLNNAVNKDDYGMSERIEAAAKLVVR